MTRVVNRVLLGVIGALLFVLGAAVLVAGLDLRRRWGFETPAHWPFTDRADVLLSRSDRTRWRAESWWWPMVIGGLAIVLLLALWWLLAQLRRRRVTTLSIDTGDGGDALLRGRALEDALAAEAQTVDGVERARVVLHGRRRTPHATVRLTLAPHVRPAAALESVRAGALEHARTAADLHRLPTDVRLKTVRHRAERVN